VEVSGFRFDQLFAQAGRVDFELAADAADHLAVEALMPVESSRPLLEMLGQDFDTLKRRAVQRDFVPVPLNARVTFEVSNTLSEVVSHNVIARLAGSDPVLKDDVIVYTAHWDTFGRDDALAGHPIYPGAADNATGVGALLEIARAYARAPQRPRRSVLFIATTGEEHGLLGARHYVAHPLYPLAQTLIDLNLDIANPWGSTRDLEVIGLGDTDLDPLLDDVAAAQALLLSPDRNPAGGSAYRQDAREFTRAGVPSLYVRGGFDYIGKPWSYTLDKVGGYYRNDYHKITDTVRRDWDVSGTADLARFIFAVGYRLAQGGPMPKWRDGAEFKAKRDAMLRDAAPSGKASATPPTPGTSGTPATPAMPATAPAGAAH
jgi:Zn-dependent M28 family amino/carboxypeptidase